MSIITQGTVSQTRSPSNVEIIQNNGQGPGTLTNMEISSEGFIVGNFSNGETKNLFKIPLAMFANVNGLIPSVNGTYRVSNDSGPLLLKGAGEGGAGKLIGGSVELSNIDITEQIIGLQDIAIHIQAVTKDLALKNERDKQVINELGR